METSAAMARPPNTDFKTLIVGLGKTGVSCARYLRAQGVSAAATDSRPNPPGLEQLRREMPELPVFVGGFDPAVFGAAEQLVVSPGVPVAQPLIQHFVQALRQAGLTQIEQGVFGAEMQVRIYNDGPVTILLDTDEL